jgi:hypothetical protein
LPPVQAVPLDALDQEVVLVEGVQTWQELAGFTVPEGYEVPPITQPVGTTAENAEGQAPSRQKSAAQGAKRRKARAMPERRTRRVGDAVAFNLMDSDGVEAHRTVRREEPLRANNDLREE